MRLLGWFTVLCGGWFLLLLGWTQPAAKPIGAVLLGAHHALSGVVCYQVAGSAALSPAARRFWRMIARALFVVAGSVLLSAAGPVVMPVAAAAQIAGMLMMLWALARLPMLPKPGARLAISLDFSIAAAAGLLVLWRFGLSTRLNSWADVGTHVSTLIGIGGVGLTCLFLIVKVVLTGRRTLTRSALQMFGLAALAGGMSPVLATELGDKAMLLVVPLVGLLIALGARRQYVDCATGRIGAAPKRSYSLLPYLAVGMVDALLIHAIVDHDPDLLVMALVTVLLTVLVVIRQFVAFRENHRLISRLDAGLLDLRDAQQKLSHEATHDALTGLANRVLFGDRLRTSLADPTSRVTVVLIDLDDFKIVNDTLGHAAGDALLVAVAERLRTGFRPSDTVARLGGDEFALMLDGLGGDNVDRLLVRIAESLLVPVEAEDHLLSVRASFGFAEGARGEDPDALLRRADIAMYEAKQRGEGGYQRYVEGMEASGARNARTVTDLRSALDNGELVLYYQPVVTLPEGQITGVEALIRWQHPERGLLGPAEFVPAAEESGLIVPIGAWVLGEACRQAAAWPGLSLAVNVSARQLQQPGLTATVAAALDRSGMPARSLILEITESTAVGGGATHATLRELRAMGVRISLDDFGTGASSLSLLRTCPVDQIKLDRSFLPSAAGDAIARAVRQLADAFGLEAVAEGVETPKQAAELTALGYGVAQGYLFAHPVPAAEIATSAPA